MITSSFPEICPSCATTAPPMEPSCFAAGDSGVVEWTAPSFGAVDREQLHWDIVMKRGHRVVGFRYRKAAAASFVRIRTDHPGWLRMAWRHRRPRLCSCASRAQASVVVQSCTTPRSSGLVVCAS